MVMSDDAPLPSAEYVAAFFRKRLMDADPLLLQRDSVPRDGVRIEQWAAPKSWRLARRSLASRRPGRMPTQSARTLPDSQRGDVAICNPKVCHGPLVDLARRLVDPQQFRRQ